MIKNKKNISKKLIKTLLILPLLFSTIVKADEVKVTGGGATADIPSGGCTGLRCSSIYGIGITRISFIDSDGNYMKNDVTGEDLRIIEISSDNWGSPGETPFYNKNTLDGMIDNNVLTKFDDMEIPEKRLTGDYAIKRILSRKYTATEGTIKSIVNEQDRISTDDILQIADIWYEYRHPLDMKKKLAEKITFNGKEYNYNDLLYILSHMSINECNKKNISGCEEEFKKWEQVVEDYKTRKLTDEKIRNDYVKFINKSYIMVEPMIRYTPGVDDFPERKKLYIMTAMEFFIAAKTKPYSTYYDPAYNSVEKKWITETYDYRNIARETDWPQIWYLNWAQTSIFCGIFTTESPEGLAINMTQNCTAGVDNQAFVASNPNLLYNETKGKIGLNSIGMVTYKVTKTEDEIPEIPEIPETPKNCDFKINNCDVNNGKFGITSELEQQCLYSDLYKDSKINDGTNEAYCYESSVNFDFSDLYSTFNNKNLKNIKPNKKIEFKPGKLNIIKKCYSNTNNEEFAKNKVEQFVRPNFATGDAKIDLTLFEEEAYEKKVEYEIVDSTPKTGIQIGKIDDNTSVYTYTYTYELKPINDDSLINGNSIIISNNLASGLYNSEFKMSGSVINKIKSISSLNKNVYDKLIEENGKYIEGLSTYRLNIEEKEFEDTDEIKTAFKCDLTTEVLDGIKLENTKFRVISLAFPFPGKDGTTRLPGLNWLGLKNYAFKYITNNRNIQCNGDKECLKLIEKKINYNGTETYYKSDNKGLDVIKNPEAIYYEREPLYVIKLDAQNMMKTREYNKTHKYTELDLRCLSGRKCLSAFVRENFAVTGDCAVGGYPQHILVYAAMVGTGSQDKYGDPIKNFDRGYTNPRTGEKRDDPDGVVNALDASYNLSEYANKAREKGLDEEKYTDFYLCADKDRNSSG